MRLWAVIMNGSIDYWYILDLFQAIIEGVHSAGFTRTFKDKSMLSKHFHFGVRIKL